MKESSDFAKYIAVEINAIQKYVKKKRNRGKYYSKEELVSKWVTRYAANFRKKYDRVQKIKKFFRYIKNLWSDIFFI